MPITEAHRQKRIHLARQVQQSLQPYPTKITCICELSIPIRFLYKCLYCGQWLCRRCAQNHFGMTVEEYRRQNPESYD